MQQTGLDFGSSGDLCPPDEQRAPCGPTSRLRPARRFRPSSARSDSQQLRTPPQASACRFSPAHRHAREDATSGIERVRSSLPHDDRSIPVRARGETGPAKTESGAKRCAFSSALLRTSPLAPRSVRRGCFRAASAGRHRAASRTSREGPPRSAPVCRIRLPASTSAGCGRPPMSRPPQPPEHRALRGSRAAGR